MNVMVRHDPCKIEDKEQPERVGNIIATRIINARNEYQAWHTVAWNDGKISTHHSKDLRVLRCAL